MKTGRWTKDEISYLRSHIDDPVRDIAKILNRKPSSVSHKKLYENSPRVKNYSKDDIYFDPYTNSEIKSALKRVNLTQKDLAIYVGIGESTMASMLTGRKNTMIPIRMLATLVLKDMEKEVIDWRKM